MENIAPARTALVVVDVQNDFVADGGFFDAIGADVKTAQRRIPALVRLIAAARSARVPVVFVQAIYDPQYVSAPMRERNRRRGVERPRCLTGSWGADFYEVKPLPGEPVVIKHRYSAVPNTDFLPVLRRLGVDSLLLAGVATDTCVESTARDAYFIDYYVTIVADCCAAYDENDHLGALRRFERDYGAVVTAAEVMEAWSRLGVPTPEKLKA
jgi:ureidoacrylate peracid hydrolase